MKINISKVILAIISSAILLFILWGVTDFVGNPITKIIAKREIKSYVEDNYLELDLELNKVRYNFKFDNYSMKVYSNNNVDIDFNVYYSNGEVQDDSYDEYVLSKSNTIERLAKDYSDLATNLINNLGYENKTLVTYDREYLEQINVDELISLGMEFDRTLPLKTEVIMNIGLDDLSINNISSILKKIHYNFIDNDCDFDNYTIYSEKDNTFLTLRITKENIENSNLEELLLKALAKEEKSKSIDNDSTYISIMNKN